MIEPSKWAAEAAKHCLELVAVPRRDGRHCTEEQFQNINQAAIESATAELMIERDNWKACSEAEHADKLEIVKERDSYKVECECRVHWMQELYKIIGYDNSDGHHGSPGPHEIVKALVRERDQLKTRLTTMTALLDRMQHDDTNANFCMLDCPACAWERMKEEVEPKARKSKS